MLTQRQRDFIEAAMQIAAEKGLSKLTIRNLAREVGVSEAAVYRHFPSKLALLTAILEDLQEVILPHFRKLDKGNEGEDLEILIDGFIRGLFHELEKRPAYAAFVFSEEAFHTDPQLRPFLSKMMQETLLVLTDSSQDLQKRDLCRDDVKPKNLAMMLMGSIRLTITKWHLANGSFALSETADELIGAIKRLYSSS